MVLGTGIERNVCLFLAAHSWIVWMRTMVIKKISLKNNTTTTGVPDEALWMEFFWSEEARELVLLVRSHYIIIIT